MRARRLPRLRSSVRPFLLLLVVLVVQGCGTGPRQVEKTVSVAPADTGTTFLARRADSLGNPHDGRSGFYLLNNGIEALAARLMLSERAERTIDAQYYLVHNDAAGQLFAGQLLDAADRGVRVRLLIDDMDTSGYDDMTAALTRHPNIEIRLFNPFRRGPGKMIASLFEFNRINRRMHNKSMTFDNQVTIVGGRNIGDEYFAAHEDSNYDDLDVLGVGPIAQEVSRTFDEYWNSPYAVPASAVVRDKDGDLSLDEARERLSALVESARQTEYGEALTHGIRGAVDSGTITLDWVPAKVFADPPQKAAGETEESEILISEMAPFVRSAQNELVVSSAYFVPGPRGTAFLTGLAEKGVNVRILTNSLDSTDVEPVHGHYARYREELLGAGVELWELRPDNERPDRDWIGLGHSLSGLHTKAFAIDRRYLFVGSFNWDPRSANINTEMGILLDAPAFAQEAVRGLHEKLPRAAYRLHLNEDGEIEWLARREDGVWVAYGSEPSDSGWRSFRTNVYGILPIGGQL